MNRRLIVKKSLALSMSMMLTLWILMSLATPVMARENSAPQAGHLPTAPSKELGPTDPAELESFLDDFFASAMEEYHIAGAAIAVVKDGKLFFAKGYGYADLEHGIPVDPEKTIFRIGSNGKTFTWTAVMQLVEKGSWTSTRISAPILTFASRIPIPNQSPSKT